MWLSGLCNAPVQVVDFKDCFNDFIVLTPFVHEMWWLFLKLGLYGSLEFGRGTV